MHRQHLHTMNGVSARLNRWLQILLIAGLLFTGTAMAPSGYGRGHGLITPSAVHACTNQGGGGEC